MTQYEIKPNKSAYVTYPLLRAVVIFGLIAVGATLLLLSFTSSFSLLVLPWIIYSAIILYENFSLQIRYKKERYVISGDRFLHYSGGIFFDHKTELVVRNITHVHLTLPWIEHKLYKTGHIRIEAAGSAGAEVHLTAIDKPVAMQKYVLRILQRNGFKLARKQHIQQERPATIGVAVDVFGYVFIGLLVGMQTLFPLVIGLFSVGLNIVPILILVFFGGIALFVFLFMKFMDLIRRRYDIYNDTITYSEGFLTKHFSVIPVENLADSFVKQNILDQILNIYDVKISVQGTGSEINFTNMRHGTQLEKNIDRVIAAAKPLPVKKEKIAKRVKAAQAAVKRDIHSIAQFRMNGPRTLLPLAIIGGVVLLVFLFALLLGVAGFGLGVILAAGSFLPLVFGGLVVSFVTQLIAYAVTKYEIKPSGFQEDYEFLNKRHTEFSADKVTAIVFKRNIFDKMFDTSTIGIWSIGSGETINFKNIKRFKDMEKTILSKVGIKPQQLLYLMPSRYSISSMFSAYLPLHVLMGLFIIASFFIGALIWQFFVAPLIVALVYAAVIVYSQAYFERSQLTYYKDYVYYRRGLIQTTEYFVLYDNLKDITTKKYPFMNTGSIRFNVAGEQRLQSSKSVSFNSNAFTVPYVRGIDVKDELIDLILFQRPNPQQVKKIEADIPTKHQKPVYSSKPHALSASFFGIVLSVLLFPIGLVIFGFIYWQAKVTSYHIDPFRLRKNYGILYKSQKSVIFQRIDHLTVGQGAVNKMFNNGSIGVQTTGSSSTELSIDYIPDYKKFYDLLNKHY